MNTRPAVQVLALVIGGATTAHAQCPLSFAPAANYSSDDGARSVAISDVNGDGRPNLAVENTGSNSVSVLLGNGNGTFQAAVHYGAGPRPDSVAIGDVSGDAKPDMAVANFNSNNVSVLMNNSASVGIVQQPVSQTATEGQDVTMSVTATNAVAYHWRRNGVPLVKGDVFSDVTTSTLMISGATAAEARIYDVQLGTACNAGVLSQPAMLVVNPVALLCPADYNGDGFLNGDDFDEFVADFEIGC